MDTAITGAAIARYIDTATGASPAPLDEMEERAEREAFPVIGPEAGRFLALITAVSGARRILELGSGFGYSAIWFARGLARTAGEESPAGAPAARPGPPAAGAGPHAGNADKRPKNAGLIHCTDTSPMRRDAALEYFSRAGVGDLVHFEVADALEYARALAARIEAVAAPPASLSGAARDAAAPDTPATATAAGEPEADGPPAFDIIFNDVDKHAYPEVPALAARLLRPGGLLITDNTLWYGLVADPTATDADTEGVRTYNRIVTSTKEWESSIVPMRDGITISRRI